MVNTAKYRARLPQLSGPVFLTNGGMETTLIFHDGIKLPHFAAFDLQKNADGLEQVRRYYARYARLARDAGLGFVLESPTWRANADWAAKLVYSRDTLADMNRKAIEVMAELRTEYETPRSPMVISGNIGPRGDGYQLGAMMSAQAAEDYHAEQVAVFCYTEAALISAFTLSYPNEAIGIARAAKAAGIPSVISFTLETDGRLPNGGALKDAIAEVNAATGNASAYYMINCAHPTHFDCVLAASEPWVKRIHGLRANALTCSHAATQPRRARSGNRSRCRRSGRARPAVSRSAPQVPPHQRDRRLLRHRLPPRRENLLRLRGSDICRETKMAAARPRF